MNFGVSKLREELSLFRYYSTRLTYPGPRYRAARTKHTQPNAKLNILFGERLREQGPELQVSEKQNTKTQQVGNKASPVILKLFALTIFYGREN